MIVGQNLLIKEPEIKDISLGNTEETVIKEEKPIEKNRRSKNRSN